MNKTNVVVSAIVAALVAVIVGTVVGGNQSQNVGASGTRFPNGLSADTTSPVPGQVRGTTLTTTGAATFGGNVNVTTVANATSTLTAGCVTTYATSSQTPVKLKIGGANASTTIDGQTSIGFVMYQYGTCP